MTIIITIIITIVIIIILLLLLLLLDHENIVKLHKVLKPLDSYNYSDIYIVFEALQTDLAQIIRSPQPITTRHIQFFTFQLFNAIAYLHTCNVVHRDLKPRNLLVNGNCTLKVADFGLSRIYNDSNQTKMLAMTEYVTTRWYRAPEILVGFPIYGKQVDIWAIGCILGELILRFPIFPGKDSKHQLYYHHHHYYYDDHHHYHHYFYYYHYHHYFYYYHYYHNCYHHHYHHRYHHYHHYYYHHHHHQLIDCRKNWETTKKFLFSS